jgi:hypothetical protein
MFIPFLAATAVATAFAQLGALSVKLSIATAALNAMTLLSIILALYILWLRHKA